MITEDILRLRCETAMDAQTTDDELRKAVWEAYSNGYVKGVRDVLQAYESVIRDHEQSV